MMVALTLKDTLYMRRCNGRGPTNTRVTPMMLSPRLRILGICACALISFSSMTMANDAMTPYTAKYELLRNGSRQKSWSQHGRSRL